MQKLSCLEIFPEFQRRFAVNYCMPQAPFIVPLSQISLASGERQADRRPLWTQVTQAV